MFDLNSKIAVIAAGRLGSSLATALIEKGLNVVSVSTRRESHRKWIAERLPKVHVSADFAEASSLADIVFITSTDSAIEEMCRKCNWKPAQAVVHCSGALGLNVLKFAADASASVGSMHPLQTFPSPDSHRLLSRITFAIESDSDDLMSWLSNLTELFEGSRIIISGADERAAYHASAVMSCGLLTGLVGIAAEMWEIMGIERSDAVDKMTPMIISSAAEIAKRGIPDALTGPFTRGDVPTIHQHLAATQRQSNDVSRAYAALALAQLHIAAEQGALDNSKIEEIKKLLKDHLGVE